MKYTGYDRDTSVGAEAEGPRILARRLGVSSCRDALNSITLAQGHTFFAPWATRPIDRSRMGWDENVWKIFDVVMRMTEGDGRRWAAEGTAPLPEHLVRAGLTLGSIPDRRAGDGLQDLGRLHAQLLGDMEPANPDVVALAARRLFE